MEWVEWQIGMWCDQQIFVSFAIHEISSYYTSIRIDYFDRRSLWLSGGWCSKSVDTACFAVVVSFRDRCTFRCTVRFTVERQTTQSAVGSFERTQLIGVVQMNFPRNTNNDIYSVDPQMVEYSPIGTNLLNPAWFGQGVEKSITIAIKLARFPHPLSATSSPITRPR